MQESRGQERHIHIYDQNSMKIMNLHMEIVDLHMEIVDLHMECMDFP